jgi:hypothetical protein
MPFRLVLKVDVAVVGVCGGEEGPACWAKLKLGVVGRMAADDCIVTGIADWLCVLIH